MFRYYVNNYEYFVIADISGKPQYYVSNRYFTVTLMKLYIQSVQVHDVSNLWG